NCNFPFLLSSTDCLYIIICIGHIADCSKPYRHRLESVSANIGYRLELFHRLVSRSTVLFDVYMSCQLQDQTDWHVRISSTSWTYTGAKQISQAVCFFASTGRGCDCLRSGGRWEK
ncbi:Os11g0578033, partial [Oryza sativa Japonica Group]